MNEAKVETSECAFHGVEEDIVPGGIICTECWHVYPTPEELLKEWKELNEWTYQDTGRLLYQERAQQALSLDWKEVPFCPLCLHDSLRLAYYLHRRGGGE